MSFQLPPFRLRETDTQRGKVACLMAQEADNVLSSCFSGLNVACISLSSKCLVLYEELGRCTVII